MTSLSIKVLGSSSKGNCYLIGDENDAILLECGLNFKDIKKGVGYNLHAIKACIVTHNHGDHIKGYKGVLESGIPLYCSKGTAVAVGLTPEHYRTLSHGVTKVINGWFSIKPFTVDHDVPEPLGFIIEANGKRILFVTDTYILRYDFKNWDFDCIMMEANYCEKIAKEIRKNKGDDYVNKRRLKQHMSFQTAVKTLEKLNLQNTSQIVLIHLSDGMTDAKRFVKVVQERFGIPTEIAVPELKIQF